MGATIDNQKKHREWHLLGNHQDVIFFIHGILGSPDQFRFLAEELSHRGFDCVSLLLPGHGGSARDFTATPSSRWPIYVKAQVQAAMGKYQRVFMIGHSLGGLISLECAACGGIDGIVLINTPLAFRISLKQLAFSTKIMLSSNDHGDEFMASYRDAFSITGIKIYEYPLWLRQFAGLLRYSCQSKTHLPHVRSRVLVVQSARDESVARRSVRLLETGLTHAETQSLVLDESYHGHFTEGDKQILLSHIEEFLKRRD